MSNQTITPGAGALYFEYSSQPQNIIPGTGTLVMTLLSRLIPQAGALNFTGSISPQTLTIPAPLSANAGLQGYAPVVRVGIQTFITPGTGIIGFVGLSPRDIFGTVIVPNTWDWNDPNAKFDNPLYTMDGCVQVQINITGYAPVVSLNSHAIVITGANLSILGQTPSLGIKVPPGTVALAIQGNAPNLSQSINIAPSAGSLSINGQSVSPLKFTSFPGVGSCAFTGYAPQIGINIFPLTGALSFIGNLPGIGSKGFIMAQTALLSLTGYAPVLISPVSITPPTGAIGVNGAAPVDNQAVTVVINFGAITFIGYTPNVFQTPTIIPSTGFLGFLGAAAQLLTDAPFEPQAGELDLIAQAPVQILGDVDFPPTSDNVGLIGYAPTLSQNFNIVPQTGGLGLASDPPNSLVPQFVFPDVGSLSLTANAPIVITAGPPIVSNVPIVLLQSSVSVLFSIPGSNDMPTPTITVNELNAIAVDLGPFLDVNGIPFIPQALQWLLWDDTNKIQVQDYMPLNPAEFVSFIISGSLNNIDNPVNLAERRMVLIQTTLPGGEIRYDPAYYNILAIPDLA